MGCDKWLVNNHGSLNSRCAPSYLQRLALFKQTIAAIAPTSQTSPDIAELLATEGARQDVEKRSAGSRSMIVDGKAILSQCHFHSPYAP